MPTKQEALEALERVRFSCDGDESLRIVRSFIESAGVDVERATNERESLAMMIRMLVSSLRRFWPYAPQPNDLPSRAVDLLRGFDLLGTPLRQEDAAITAAKENQDGN